MKSNNSVTVLEALKDPHLFGGLPAFRDLTTWSAWIVFLKATYGLALTRHEQSSSSSTRAARPMRRQRVASLRPWPSSAYNQARARWRRCLLTTRPSRARPGRTRS